MPVSTLTKALANETATAFATPLMPSVPLLVSETPAPANVPPVADAFCAMALEMIAVANADVAAVALAIALMPIVPLLLSETRAFAIGAEAVRVLVYADT